jgi:hypothetical protein
MNWNLKLHTNSLAHTELAQRLTILFLAHLVFGHGATPPSRVQVWNILVLAGGNIAQTAQQGTQLQPRATVVGFEPGQEIALNVWNAHPIVAEFRIGRHQPREKLSSEILRNPDPLVPSCPLDSDRLSDSLSEQRRQSRGGVR